MASDYLLEIEGIKGESTDSKHPNSIEIESFSWGATQPGAHAGGGGGGAGKVVFQDIHFVSQLSSASPELFLACATGQHIKKAILFVRKAGKEQQEYYKVTLEDILVSSYQQAGDATNDAGASVPVDQFSLNFTRIGLDYKVQKADGSLDRSVQAGYDLKANKKI